MIIDLPSPIPGSVLGHQGGWDEVAFVVLPLGIFGALVLLSNRRAARPTHDDTDPEPPGPPT